MLNNPYRTSLTRDEIVAILLGWLDGPCIYSAMEDASPEEQELVESNSYCLLEDRENRLDNAYDNCIECLEKGQPAEICKKPVDDFKREDEALKQFCDEVDDEISKGDKSMLRVDRRSSTPHDICYTRISVEEWIKNRCVDDSSVSKGLIQASKTDSSQGKSKKMVLQQKLILKTLTDFGFNPEKLPAPTQEGGARSQVVKHLDEKEPFENSKAFQHAWTALLKSKQIGYENNEEADSPIKKIHGGRT